MQVGRLKAVLESIPDDALVVLNCGDAYRKAPNPILMRAAHNRKTRNLAKCGPVDTEEGPDTVMIPVLVVG